MAARTKATTRRSTTRVAASKARRTKKATAKTKTKTKAKVKAKANADVKPAPKRPARPKAATRSAGRRESAGTSGRARGIGGGVPVYTLVRRAGTLTITLEREPDAGAQTVMIVSTRKTRFVDVWSATATTSGSDADRWGVSVRGGVEIGSRQNVVHL